MVRRKEWLGKGEKSIIQRRKLHSEPCWCELYKSEQWRAIKKDVKIENMVFEQRTWFSSPVTNAWSCHSFYHWLTRKPAKLFVLPPLHSYAWKGAVSSVLPRIRWPSCLPQIVPDCPSWDHQNYDGWCDRSPGKSRLPMAQRERVFNENKRSCFVFVYPEGQHPLQLAGVPLLSSQPSWIVKWRRVGQHVQIHPLSQ